VLVSYRLNNPISILQTKFSDREGHEAGRIGLKVMPLGQHIKGRHGKREPGVAIRRMAKISKRVALPQVTSLPRWALHLELQCAFAHTDLPWKPSWQK